MDEPEDTALDTEQTGEETSAADSSRTSYVTAEQFAEQFATLQKEIMNGVRKTVAGIVKTQTQPTPPVAPTKTQPNQPTPGMTPEQVAELLSHDRQTTMAIASNGLSGPQGEIARQLIKLQQPEDPAAFIASFAKDMGVEVPGSPSPESKKSTPNPNPTSDRGAPGMTPSTESDDVPMWKWSKEKTERYVAKHGLRKFTEVAKQRLAKEMHGVQFDITGS